MPRSALALLAVSAFLAGPAMSADVPTKVVEKTLGLASNGRLVLQTYKGSVTVTGWDREEASIHAVITPDGSCANAAEIVEKTRVRIEGGGQEVRVVSDYDALPAAHFTFFSDCSSRPFVKYEIRMPRGASLRVKDHKSRISVDSLAGDAAIDSYKGVVRLTRLSGKLDVETFKGDLVAELDRVAGDLHAGTYKGDIELVLPKGARVDLDEKIGRRGHLEAGVEAVRGGPRLSVETYKGTIRLRTK